MKGVILAAGVASRLRPLTDGVPKALLPIGGEPLLGRTLRGLEAHGLRDVVIVTGYRSGQIRSFVGTHFPGLPVAFVHNPVYETTNNIYSLWLAREEVVRRGMILLDGDILFDDRILGLLLAVRQDACLAVDARPGLGDEEMKVSVDGAGRVRKIGKDIPPAEALGESIGIELFGPAAVGPLYDAIEGRVVRQGAVGIFYESAFQDWIDRGGRLQAVPIESGKAIEIDTAEDIKTAERKILPFLHRARR
jgi:choline kinase